ncbi:hypothetical protein CNMCM8980_010028 [Aspergillus fumigatiaffinis]|jgi:hypothetical protein|uniref:Uncharacterized protein n=1 Tax=Aspergillus fumigatiaffinis TaxID=340414 RepID=A0A8H4LZT7_9EURO|nr:hypothetical protein CNMCM5878_004215 [Aspergillus fumigatiaffinis]KAF4223930.1 hypothetical protein CNMCM6457_010038 [Aspergillus fumigatiaffinis]KAF4234153.1 hypothetical protein CNMCM6805_008859 [Aspergillus fumigatiaffinis]KAF4244582.1 hypothetical protein CNMCM8980_010028 [Aspergillus fumigatiaffinis]
MSKWYHIRSVYTYNDEKCISIRHEELELKPLNDTNDGGGPSQWFELVPGTGRYKGCFAIRQSRNFIHSPLGEGSLKVAYQPYYHTALPEEYFSFVFEDTEVYKIDFNLANATTTGNTKRRAFEQKVSNGGSTDATMKLDLKQSKAVTGSFNRSHGFSIELKSKLKVKSVPWIGPEGEFELNGKTEHNWTFGETNTWTESIGFEVSTVVPPKHICIGKGIFKKDEMSVPVKIYSRSKSTGVDAITEAVYTGVAVWGYTYTIDHQPLEARNS